MNKMPTVINGPNPYAREVQGKANEPITVAALLDRARSRLLATGWPVEGLNDVTLDVIYDRLQANSPRIAIIGGSLDHPAHIVDPDTTEYAAARIWERGGVPFAFSAPVLCDGTAQSTIGMCYSLASRNLTAATVVNQMEAHSYHGAFVIQGCDKQPLAIVAGLAMLDVVRQDRGEAPVFATFAPAHVLKGGVIPDDLKAELNRTADIAADSGFADIGEDLRDALRYILQCTSGTAFQGVLKRAQDVGIITDEEHQSFEKRLAVNTCDSKGGICAFNGTGNSSRHVVSALGLVHPALELLTEPATPSAIYPAVDALFEYCNRPEFSVGLMVRRNMDMAVRVHSATGGSTNIMLHLVGAAVSAGMDFDIWEYDRIRRARDVPDIFNYSLTEGRDIFALAQQCCSGSVRGMETVIYELDRLGVPVPLDAPTAAAKTWRERLSNTNGLAASGVTNNPIILSEPRRPVSGIDVLTGNWFESAVVKISGMTDSQLAEFDGHIAAVIYFENEELASEALLDGRFLETLGESEAIPNPVLAAMRRHNLLRGQIAKAAQSARVTGAAGVSARGGRADEAFEPEGGGRDLFRSMVADGSLRLAIVIAGQGPEAFGMPEMFTPMHHINTNRVLRKLAVLLSDGRYSGVTYGAAVGHVTPESINRGRISGLKNGDALLLSLSGRRIDWVEVAADGGVRPFSDGDIEAFLEARGELIEARLARLKRRAGLIAPTNRLVGMTDAAHGVVPVALAEWASIRSQDAGH